MHIKAIKVKSDRDYTKGDRVYMSYGLKSSAECVEDHSFCPVLSSLEDACCEVRSSLLEGVYWYNTFHIWCILV